MAEPAGITELLTVGLKTSGARGKAIANNIANLETPGYRRKDVRFEEALMQALKRGDAKLDGVQAEIVEPRTNQAGPNGNDVNLDEEIGEMVRNSARYKTCMRVLQKVYRQMEMAITGQ
jgi:flagellar basal-body rod protein FlgB